MLPHVFVPTMLPKNFLQRCFMLQKMIPEPPAIKYDPDDRHAAIVHIHTFADVRRYAGELAPYPLNIIQDPAGF